MDLGIPPVLLLIKVIVLGALVVKLLTVGPMPGGPDFWPEVRLWLKLPLLLAPALLILEALPGLAVVPGLARVKFNFGTLVTCFGFCLAE